MDELEKKLDQNFWPLLAIALGLFLVLWGLGLLLGKKLAPWLEKRIDEDKHPIPALLVHGFRWPLMALCMVTGLCLATLTLSGWNMQEAPRFLASILKNAPGFIYKTLRISVILCISWGLLASSDIAGLLVRRTRQKMDLRMDTSVTRFLSGLFKVIVVAITVVILLSEFHYNINGLITGLGLGGLTVALAAKDSASNFFGGMVLVIDKPFEIGDWVSCGGVEGTVEDINMRNTIIRNDSGSLTTMPNALLSAAPITNFSSAMNQRRADVTLSLVYSTSHQQIKQFAAALRGILETDAEVVSDSVLVRFSNFSPSSLDIRVIYYTTLSGFGEHLRIRERINYGIMDLAEKQGLSFAHPTQTVELRSSQKPEEPRA